MWESLDCHYHYCCLENWLSQPNFQWLNTGIQSLVAINTQVSLKFSSYWIKPLLYLPTIIWLCLIGGILYASRILVAKVLYKYSCTLSNSSEGTNSKSESKVYLNLRKEPSPWIHEPNFLNGPSSPQLSGPNNSWIPHTLHLGFSLLQILIAMFHNFMFCSGYIWGLYMCGCALYNYSNVTEPEKYSLEFTYHPLLSLTFLPVLRFPLLYTPFPAKGPYIPWHTCLL